MRVYTDEDRVSCGDRGIDGVIDMLRMLAVHKCISRTV